MADPFGVVAERRKTFFRCDCPPRPRSNHNRDIIEWYMHHIQSCSPRNIVDLPLPPFEGDE